MVEYYLPLFICVIVLLNITDANDQSQPNQNVRVAYGRKAAANQFPYQISLVIAKSGLDRHLCGGSIISSKSVLTAAHCVDGKFDVYFYRVYAGSTKVLSESSGTHVTRVERIIIHPQWDAAKLVGDVALVKVMSPFTFKKPNIKSIPLAQDTSADLVSCVVSGWGLTEKSKKPEDLLFTDVVIYNFNDCELEYRPLDSKSICAYGAYGEDAGSGDSGGPLVCNGELVGIVSYGRKAQFRKARAAVGVYSDVAQYRLWIRANRSVRATKFASFILVTYLSGFLITKALMQL